MKSLIVYLALLTSPGFIYAQETLPVSAQSPLLQVLENDAGFIAVCSATNVMGIGLFLMGSEILASPQGSAFLGWSLHLTAVFSVPMGYFGGGITYAHLVDSYNQKFPSDAQNMAPFLALTLAGTAITLPLIFGEGNFSKGITSPEDLTRRNVFTGIALAGLAAHTAGMVVAVVHSQDLVAKVRAAEKAAASVSHPVTQAQTTIRPQIGPGYLGVAISMP